MPLTTVQSTEALFEGYPYNAAYDEMFASDGALRPEYTALHDRLLSLSMEELHMRQKAADESFMNHGITFTLYPKSVIRILGVSWKRPTERLHLCYNALFFLLGVSFLSHADLRAVSQRWFDTPRQRFYAFRHPPHLAMERVLQEVVRRFNKGRKTGFAKAQNASDFTPP
jgi:hypothetical protein